MEIKNNNLKTKTVDKLGKNKFRMNTFVETKELSEEEKRLIKIAKSIDEIIENTVLVKARN